MNHRLKKILFGVILLQVALLFAGDQLTVKRDRAVLREGPGAFFPALAELSEGAQFELLEESEGWYKIQINDMTGYVSSKVTEGKAKRQDIFAQMGQQKPVTEVAQSGVSAAVKGFANKFTQRLNGDQEFLESIYSYHINPAAYQRFKQQTYQNRNLRRIHRIADLPPVERQTTFTFSEEGVGLAVAAKISQLGIYQNVPAQNYVNYVGNLVAEASNAYDVPFKFFILDQAGVNAYACPGGVIFVTKGALQAMQNEAELACFLGHEITHVVQRHGMKEMEKRKVMIKADNAFAELDQETQPDSATMATTADLENIAMESYENIFAGRLQKYEDEADRYGLIYATRAGYNPGAMLHLLGRLSTGQTDSGNDHYTPAQNAARQLKLQQWLAEEHFSTSSLVEFSDRFQRETRSLQH